MATIVIDPGHGGTSAVGGSSANNATGPNGTLEKTLTLDVGLKCRDFLLTQGQTVLMTRDSDVNLSLADRAKVAKDSAAAVFLSIHFNGFSDASVQGTETLVFTGTAAASPSRALAKLVQEKTLGVTGYADRGIKEQDLGVLDPSRHDLATAGCLVEVSFLTNPAEEIRLQDENYRKQLGEALAVALFDFVS